MSADDERGRSPRPAALSPAAAAFEAELLRQSVSSLRLEQAQLIADCDGVSELAKRLHERASRLRTSVRNLGLKIDQAELELGRLPKP